jgi:Cd2+/Zn2+-exporting ATPase
VALETADVAQMGDDLARLPFAIGLSRSTSRIIRQNLCISLGMVAMLAPADAVRTATWCRYGVPLGSTLLVVRTRYGFSPTAIGSKREVEMTR